MLTNMLPKSKCTEAELAGCNEYLKKMQRNIGLFGVVAW